MDKKMTGAVRIGIGGWTYEPWRGSFYPAKHPQKLELDYASRRLTSIEINGTYYGAQKPATFAKWRDETPEDFVFSVKAPRFVMNRTVLAEAGNSVSRFLGGGVTELKGKLGPISWQFLPTKEFDPEDFGAFLKLLPSQAKGIPLRHVVEVRHLSFRCAEFTALARSHGVAISIAGDSSYPQIADFTAPFSYARIMGTKEKEPLGYSPEALDTWAARVRALASGTAAHGLSCVEPPHADGKPRDVYLYVISGHKAHNPAAATSLIDRLSALLK